MYYQIIYENKENNKMTQKLNIQNIINCIFAQIPDNPIINIKKLIIIRFSMNMNKNK